MDTNNHTPFPAIAWESEDSNKHSYITSLVRVKYRLVPTNKQEWLLRLNPNQGELFGGDHFYDNDIFKPVRYESDFVTFKPNTDIIVNAVSHSPTGQAEKHWQCGVEVFSPDGKLLNHSELNISGKRQWEKVALIGWTETFMKAVTRVPVRYDHAYGGKIPNPDAEKKGEPLFIAYNEYNSVGTGITHKHMPNHPFPVHQVSWVNKTLEKQKAAAGFGFTHRSWKPRINHAGTYDQNWLEQQHPYPPHDFDDYHHQAANPELIMQGYIQPHSTIRLRHLMKQPSAWFRLPELHCFCDTNNQHDETERYHMNIDTVLIDIESDQQEDWAVYLSYRHKMPLDAILQTLIFKYLPTDLLNEKEPLNTQQANNNG